MNALDVVGGCGRKAVGESLRPGLVNGARKNAVYLGWDLRSSSHAFSILPLGRELYARIFPVGKHTFVPCGSGSLECSDRAQPEEDQSRVLASLDKVCPKCAHVITPAKVRRIDFERIECPVCGERFAPGPKK
jgi:hypothetical protein